LVARMVHATADESFAATAVIGDAVVVAAVAALGAGAPVVCDSAMVRAGVPAVEGTRCYLDRIPVAPPGSTRSAAAIGLAVAEHPEGALWVIGNAPTALSALVDAWEAGRVQPAALIGLPVGYVGASESKARLWASGLRDISVTNVGVRGGSPVAAAVLNAIARFGRQASEPASEGSR
jgi:precorrin-8X/cobalt-precorrin-8 methylmutase